ncbi:ANK3 [Symbiodinium sp. CCMP2592]|nr:ANK3 [Symbiodinium sp. CCMP2592]
MPCKGGGDGAAAEEAEVVLRAAITGVPHLAVPVQLCREEADFLGYLRMRCHEQLKLPYFRSTFVSETRETRGALHGARSWESLGCPMKISVLTNGFLPEEDAAYEAYRQMILKAAESENSKEAAELIARALFAFQDPDVSDDRGETATWKVCRKGDVGQLRLLLLGDADVTKADDQDSATPLFVAAQEGHLEVLRLLCLHCRSKEEHLDKSQKAGATPLYVASQNGHLACVEVLTDAKADLSRETLNKTTPLLIAAQKGHHDILKYLLRAGAPLKRADAPMKDVADATGTTALCIAAQNGHQTAVETLLEVAACIDAANRDGATALFKACQRGRVGVVRLLLDNMATVDYPGHDGTTPLIIAAHNGHMDVVELLVQARADIAHATNAGSNVFLVSAQRSNMEMLRYLMRHSCDESRAMEALHEGVHECDARQSDAQRSSLSRSVQAGEVAVVKCLHEAAIDINMKLDDGIAPLVFACRSGKVDMVRVLVRAGPSQHDIMEARHVAQISNHLECERHLPRELDCPESL